MISLLVPLLLSVVVVDFVAAHPSAFRHKHAGVQVRHTQHKLQEKELGEMLCPSTPDINGSCDVLTQEGQKCDYQKMYSGCGTTEEEQLECIPTLTCTCNALGDETWGCIADAMMDTCFDGTARSEMGGIDCTPSQSPTSSPSDGDSDGTSATGSATGSTGSAGSASSAAGSNSDVNNDDGGVDLLDAINDTADDNSAVVVDGTTTAITDAVDNGIDLGEVAAPVVVVVDNDNDSSTITTVVEDEGKGVTVTTATAATDSMSSSSSHQGLVVANIAMAAATTTAAITIFL